MKIKLIDGSYAVCKLEHHIALTPSEFISLTNTSEEISMVCSEDAIPKNTLNVQKGFSLLKIDDILDFSLVGIIARIAGLLAAQGISIFTVSTFNTDYILLQKVDLQKAVSALSNAGYTIV